MSAESLNFPIDLLLGATPGADRAVSPEQQQKLRDKEITDEAAMRAAVVRLREMGLAHLRSDVGVKPSWRELIDLCTGFLQNTSRHTLALTLLTEALIQDHGFAGLAQGAKLYRLMLEKFPDRLRPLPQGAISRLGRHMAFVKAAEPAGNFKLTSLAVWNVPLCEVAGRSVGLYDIDLLERKDRNSPSVEGIVQAIASMDQAARERRLNDANAALLEVGQLHDAIKADLMLREGAPPPVVLEEAFRRLKNEITNYIAKAGETFQNPGKLVGADAPVAPAAQAVSAPQAGVAASNADTRWDAIRMLDAAAVYFEETDPHSLVGYHLRRAQRWLSLPLPDVMREVLGGDDKAMAMLKSWGAPAEAGVKSSGPSGTSSAADQPESDNNPLLANSAGNAGVNASAADSPNGEGAQSPKAANRDQALQLARDVARYMDSVEKHSFAKFPLAFAIEIGNMPLQAILDRVVSDESTRKELLKQLGVPLLQAQK